MYFAYIQNHLMYMIAVYGECTNYNMKELQTNVVHHQLKLILKFV